MVASRRQWANGASRFETCGGGAVGLDRRPAGVRCRSLFPTAARHCGGQQITTVAFYGFTSIWEAEDICLGWCELVVGSEYDGVLGWRAELAEVQERLGELFGRADARRQANLYLEGLLSAVERKNGWQLAEQIGDARPWRTQRVLSRTLWAADAVRDLCREYVVEHLGAADGVLVLDETGFLKKGSKSAGVARQYSGTAGRIDPATLLRTARLGCFSPMPAVAGTR